MTRKCLLTAMFVLLCSQVHGGMLEDYTRIAMENNPGLKARHAGYEAALQRVDQSGVLPDPDFSFGYVIAPDDSKTDPMKLRFGVSQMFPWIGTLKAENQAASLTAQAGRNQYLAARDSLYYEVAAAYYPLLELMVIRKLERQNKGLLDTYKTMALKRFENGTGSMVDVLLADIRLKDTETALDILDMKETALLTAFNTLLNRNPDEPVAFDSEPGSEPLPDIPAEESPFSENPSLKALDLFVKAGEARERVAEKQSYPRFGVGLSYELAVENRDDGDEVMAEFSMSLPVFRKKYRASIKEALFMRQSAAHEKEDLLNTLAARYAMTRFDLEQQRRMVSLYDRQIRTLSQALDLRVSGYANTGKGFEDLLDTRSQLLDYEKMRVSAEIRFRMELARLNTLTGRTYGDEN